MIYQFTNLTVFLTGLLFELHTHPTAAWRKSQLFISGKPEAFARPGLYGQRELYA